MWIRLALVVTWSTDLTIFIKSLWSPFLLRHFTCYGINELRIIDWIKASFFICSLDDVTFYYKFSTLYGGTICYERFSTVMMSAFLSNCSIRSPSFMNLSSLLFNSCSFVYLSATTLSKLADILRLRESYIFSNEVSMETLLEFNLNISLFTWFLSASYYYIGKKLAFSCSSITGILLLFTF